MASGYWVDSLETLKDPIRSNRWRANFNFSEVDVLKQYSTLNSQLTLTVKDVDFPGLKTATDSIFYFGFEKKLPTSVDNSGSITMTIQETESLVGHLSLVRWHQEIMNGGSFSELTFQQENNLFTENSFIDQFGLNELKPPQNTTDPQSFVNTNLLNIELYDYNKGTIIIQAKFLNVYPIEIHPAKLSYESKDLFNYNVTLNYDSVRFVHLPFPLSKLNKPNKS